MAIEYRGIEKAFDSPVLSGIDLSVKSGEMFALFGPSGTGKSVLLKTTLSLIVPDRGDVLINGESCLLYTSPSPRDRTRSRMPSSA